jgi:hypothetical protein
MTKDKALDLALKALLINCGGNTEGIGKEAITAIKQALAAPVQEPWGACVYGRVFVGRLPEHARKFSEDEGVPIQWLYTTPPAAQRKPLTLGQKQRLWSSVGDKSTLKDRVNAYGLAIEAAHGIKENT